MNKNDIYIARHGLTAWNKIKKIQGQTNNLPLSPEGIEQMHSLGKYLSTLEDEYIVLLSPMRRVQESFFIINQYLNINKKQVHILDAMKEMNFGDFEGRFKADIKEHPFFEERKANKWEAKYPKGESYSDLFKRLSHSKLYSIYEKAKEMQMAVLIIGHESINRVIPQILIPEMETHEQAAKNRQANNEIVIIKGGSKRKLFHTPA